MIPARKIASVLGVKLQDRVAALSLETQAGNCNGDPTVKFAVVVVERTKR